MNELSNGFKSKEKQIRTPGKKMLVGVKKVIDGRKAIEIVNHGKKDYIFYDDLLAQL